MSLWDRSLGIRAEGLVWRVLGSESFGCGKRRLRVAVAGLGLRAYVGLIVIAPLEV